MKPKPRDPATYIPEFFRTLFTSRDFVVIAVDKPGEFPPWQQSSYPRDDAIATALRYQQGGVRNLYFKASAFDSRGTYGTQQCARIPGFFVDVDYGLEGHRDKHPPFDTADDALAYLLTMPIRPSMAWHTGHGIQAVFLLERTYAFPPGGGPEGSLDAYQAVSSKLSKMAMSDRTHTPEHAFRIPLTVNSKAHKFAGIPDVTGTLLWHTPDRRYTFEHIQELCDGYGADDLMEVKESAAPVGVTPDSNSPVDSTTPVDCAYEELPAALREEIERDGERSDRMFGIVGTMVRQNYSDAAIYDAIARGKSFQRYGDKELSRHIKRCLDKLAPGGKRYVYPVDMAPPISIANTTEDVALHTCGPLPPELGAMLERYADVTGASLAPRIRLAARFHEHMFTSQPSGVLETPCGSGKSTWALCHIAVNAGPQRRYIYVVETLDALYRAADTLEKLTDTPVGRVHGFNETKCRELCGKAHKWWKCGSHHPKSVCHKCEAQDACHFYCRDTEIGKHILCMTHSGLSRALESDAGGIIKAARIIVDEDLSALNSATFIAADIEGLRKLQGGDKVDTSKLFPYSWLAARNELEAHGIGKSCTTFARKNYVFMDEDATAAHAGIYEDLRRLASREPAQANPFQPGDLDRARETLGALLNFFRPGEDQTATYAYREICDDDKQILGYSATRSRFTLDTDRPYDKLWVLNASAQLSPDAYPANMAVYACPDLPESSHLLTIHAVGHNPTKKRQDLNVKASRMLLHYAPRLRQHKRILIATDKAPTSADEINKQLAELYGEDVTTVWLTRGRIKGSNEARDCTLAYLTGMALFTTLTDCVLRAALQVRRTFPDVPCVLTAGGDPNWKHGMPAFPVLRNIYAMRALDELYQTMWRTAVRNDRPAEVIIAVPQPDWLVALWRTVAPRFVMSTAYKVKEEIITVREPDEPAGARFSRIAYEELQFGSDRRLDGLCVVNCPPGAVLTKQIVADTFGYHGKRPWEKNGQRMPRWLSPFFEVHHTTLIRKSYRGIRLLTQWDDSKKQCRFIREDAKEIAAVINDAAMIYKGLPRTGGVQAYGVTRKALVEAVEQGVEIWGVEHAGALAGVIGLQAVENTVVVRFAHVRRDCMRLGLGSRLLRFLQTVVDTPFVVRVHGQAPWATGFYQSNGFQAVAPAEAAGLLRSCWGMTSEAATLSVVLVDHRLQSVIHQPCP